MRKRDIGDIQARLQRREYPDYSIGIGSFGGIPQCLLNVLTSTSCSKIEWMYEGRYEIWASQSYGTHIAKESDVRGVCARQGIAPKLVDFCNTSDLDVGYLLWLESLKQPEKVATYVGVVLWQGDNEVRLTRINMISTCLSGSRIITVTALSYSQFGILK
jgi:hypothetical protein